LDILNQLLTGFQVASSWENLLFCFMGTLFGTLIGVLPGIGPTTGVAILIPITFGMNATSAIITMAGVYYGAMFGGATTSILLNVPGESASVMTCVDGHPLAKQGRAGPALGMAAMSSFIGGTFAVKYSDISTAILEEKVNNIIDSGAQVVTGCDMSCLMNIQGMLTRKKAPVQVMHIAQLLSRK